MKAAKTKLYKAAIGSALAVCVLFAIIGSGEPTRKETIESQFSPITGEHLELVKKIKAGMNDPGSFEHIEATYTDAGEYIIVSQEFTGKNEFGGRVRQVVEAKVDISGNIISIGQK